MILRRPALAPLLAATALLCACAAPESAPTPAPRAESPALVAASRGYANWVSAQARALRTSTAELVAAVRARDVPRARALYPVARTHWERIEPVAESFGDLDPRIDGREDVVEEGREFTGFHRLEKDLWLDGLRPDSTAVADRLLADVGEVARRAAGVRLTALQLAQGSKELLDEMATGKITGEEERYSHTDLHDFAANWEGSAAAVGALRPVLAGRAPDLLRAYDGRAAVLTDLLARQRSGSGYRPWTEVPAADVAALSRALDGVGEQVAKLVAVVGAA